MIYPQKYYISGYKRVESVEKCRYLSISTRISYLYIYMLGVFV